MFINKQNHEMCKENLISLLPLRTALNKKANDIQLKCHLKVQKSIPTLTSFTHNMSQLGHHDSLTYCPFLGPQRHVSPSLRSSP